MSRVVAIDLFAGAGGLSLGAQSEFFDLLTKARPELKAIAEGEAMPVDIRNDSILASSTTLRAIAGAYFLARKAGYGARDLVDGLSQLDFSPTNRQWHKIGFVTPGRSTPNARLQEVKAATELIAKAIIPEPAELAAS